MQQPQTQVDDPQLQRLYEEPHTTRERHLGLMVRDEGDRGQGAEDRPRTSAHEDDDAC